VQRLIYDVRYSTPVSQNLSIHNAGTVTISKVLCPAWLRHKCRSPLHSVSSPAISAPQFVCHTLQCMKTCKHRSLPQSRSPLAQDRTHGRGCSTFCATSPFTYGLAGSSLSGGAKDAPTHHIRLPHYRSTPELEDAEAVHFAHRTHVIWARSFPLRRWGVWCGHSSFLLKVDLKVHRSHTPEPSCFGTPLSALTRLPGPIRELRGLEDLLPETPAGGHSSPEFTKLMGWLTTHDVEAVVCPFTFSQHA